MVKFPVINGLDGLESLPWFEQKGTDTLHVKPEIGLGNDICFLFFSTSWMGYRKKFLNRYVTGFAVIAACKVRVLACRVPTMLENSLFRTILIICLGLQPQVNYDDCAWMPSPLQNHTTNGRLDKVTLRWVDSFLSAVKWPRDRYWNSGGVSPCHPWRYFRKKTDKTSGPGLSV